jgi:hypothetical protein
MKRFLLVLASSLALLLPTLEWSPTVVLACEAAAHTGRVPPGFVPTNDISNLEVLVLQGDNNPTNPAYREKMLKEGGGSKETEEAVHLGLKFLKSMQQKNGSWKLDDDAYGKDKGTANDVAGTALGVLPFLGHGVTHELTIGGAKNEHADVVKKAFDYLKSKQDKKTGLISFDANNNTGAYAHYLATIALAELYHMIKDKKLKMTVEPVAHLAVKYLVDNQCLDGGWGYLNDKNRSDLSVSGWAIVALKKAERAGLAVKPTMEKAAKYLETVTVVVEGKTEGYCYVKGQAPTPRITAVGLLCRQYLHAWKAGNDRLKNSIEKFIIKPDKNGKKIEFVSSHPDQKRDIYYYYYATQVLHHYGEHHWPLWNEAMRGHLLKTQDTKVVKGAEKLVGSWNPEGDDLVGAGGRLMYTSLCLLTLEVYYRHLPL